MRGNGRASLFQLQPKPKEGRASPIEFPVKFPDSREFGFELVVLQQRIHKRGLHCSSITKK